MNIDLIIKLAKLANNNPNDHEANSAARRVCRLLAEGNFKFNNHTAADKVNEFINRKPNPQPTTWNDVRRTTEPWNWREQYKHGTWTTPELKQCPRCLRNALVDVPHRNEYTCTNCLKTISYIEFYSKKRTSSHRCIHCRKTMTEPAEIANKICGECWKKEREKYGL